MNRHLSRDPVSLSEHVWYYEEPKGLVLVIEDRDKAGNYIRTRQHVISWRKVRSALNRKDKI